MNHSHGSTRMNDKRLPLMPKGMNFWDYKNESWSWIPVHKSTPSDGLWRDYYSFLEKSKEQSDPSILQKGGLSSQTADFLIESNYNKLPVLH